MKVSGAGLFKGKIKDTNLHHAGEHNVLIYFPLVTNRGKRVSGQADMKNNSGSSELTTLAPMDK